MPVKLLHSGTHRGIALDKREESGWGEGAFGMGWEGSAMGREFQKFNDRKAVEP
jgi:hypothetical protein